MTPEQKGPVLDSVEITIRKAFEKGDSASRDFRNKVYRSALAGLERQLSARPDLPAAAVEKRVNIAKLKDPAYVDLLARRFLVNLNSSSAGSITA